MEFSHWRISRLDRDGRALLVPVGDDGQDVPRARVWVEADQIKAGGLAVRLGD